MFIVTIGHFVDAGVGLHLSDGLADDGVLLHPPVALDTAAAVGQAPEAFALAAAFEASASFFMPFGYQTHLMVLSPGRNRTQDYLRLGGVVFVAYTVPALAVLSLFSL